MEIAVIGWGSLIWCNKALKLASKWHRDGPELSVEFARKSDDGRLTLVLVPEMPLQRTLWALSTFDDLPGVRSNLQAREGNDRTPIDSWLKTEPKSNPLVTAIANWCEAIELDGAVWTALGPRDAHGIVRAMSAVEAIGYLKGLSGHCADRAKEYICMAPEQINTPIRQEVRKTLGWKDIPLPPSLFEPI